MISLYRGDWQAEIWPERGARVMSLRYRGEPVLREAASPGELERAPMVYGMPFLFPPNRTADGRFRFEGKEYSLPINEPARHNHIHGLFADAPFSVLEAGEERVLCAVDNDGRFYPFPCHIEMEDRLDGQGLWRETRIQNTGEGRMPVEIAFHTAFAEAGSIRIPLALRWETDDRYIPTGRMLPLSGFEQALLSGTPIGGEPVSGFYTAASHTAQIGRFFYRVSEGFSDWVLFNGGGQPWLCIEPQSGPVNGLNFPDCRVLDPGESACFSQQIGLI